MAQVWTIRLTKRFPGKDDETEAIVVAGDTAGCEEILADFLGDENEKWNITISEGPRPATEMEDEQYESRGSFVVFAPGFFEW